MATQAFAVQDWVSFIHFPVRFHWITDLSGAILFGLIVTKYSTQRLPMDTALSRFHSCILEQGWQQRKGTRLMVTERSMKYLMVMEPYSNSIQSYVVQ